MTQIKLLRLINKRASGSINGFRPGQIFEVAEEHATPYLNQGCEIFNAKVHGATDAPEAKADEEEVLTVDQLKAKLDDLGIEYTKKMKRDELQALYDEAKSTAKIETPSDEDLDLE